MEEFRPHRLSPRRKAPFTREEDERLAELIKTNGDEIWHEIEDFMPGRTFVQCRERWCLYLSPVGFAGPWTPEEDALLMRVYSEFPGRWTILSKSFPKRTPSAIKCRYKLLAKKARRAVRAFIGDEDDVTFDPSVLLQIAQAHGADVR
jgi:hypothetical protein